MKSNTEKEFLENFYKNMNSSIADYKNDNNDDVFYYSFSEIKEIKSIDEELNTKENDYFKLVRVDNSKIGFSKFVFDKKFMSEESRRNHEIINTHEVFEEEYIYNNFNLIRMKEALESESFKLPAGLSIEEKRQYILSNEDIKLENIADNDKIEVIKSLLDNK